MVEMLKKKNTDGCMTIPQDEKNEDMSDMFLNPPGLINI
jgi:hypothetical protein